MKIGMAFRALLESCTSKCAATNGVCVDRWLLKQVHRRVVSAGRSIFAAALKPPLFFALLERLCAVIRFVSAKSGERVADGFRHVNFACLDSCCSVDVVPGPILCFCFNDPVPHASITRPILVFPDVAAH